jgi:hypothetical protein
MATQILQSRINAALSVPEPDVREPMRRKLYSFVGSLAELKIGETASKISPIDPTMSLADVQANLTNFRATLRNNVTSSVRQASARSGGEYSVEVTDFVTPSGQWYVIALVTCVS